MSGRKNAIIVSLVSTLLILGYYLINIFRMYQGGGLNSEDVFQLWAVVIIASIVLNILGNILTNILLNIGHAIKTNSTEEVRLLEDERDKLIALKGTRVSYIASSIGILLAMLSFVLGQPVLVMFGLLIFFGLIAEISGDLSQFYFDQKGA
jgi:hypothetical protein